MRLCAECSKEFTPNKYTFARQLYCSQKCGNRVAKRLECARNKKPLLEVCCKFCCQTFRQRDSRQKFCGKRCVDRHFKRQYKMDGQWIKALERDGRKCRLCKKASGLAVHHVDGTGETDSPNHHVDNLVVLCRSCHASVHRMEYRIVNGVIVIYSPLVKLVGRLPVAFIEQVVTPTMGIATPAIGAQVS